MKSVNLLTASLLMLTACTPAEKKSYSIKGYLTGMPDSTVLVLADVTATSEDAPLSEVMVMGGKFEINGATPEPRLVKLGVKDHYGAKLFMIENADIKIEGSVNGEDANDGKTYFKFDDVNVSGSSSHDEYMAKTLGRRQLDTAFMAMAKEYEDIRMIGMNDPRRDSIMATERAKKMMETEKKIFAALDSTYSATVAANKDSFWGPLLMFSMVNYLSPDGREMYEQFGDSAKNSYYGKYVYGLLYPVGKPGDQMPGFKAKDINGNEVDIMEFCKGKKAVLLDFWASWCRPCRKEIPNLKEIYGKYADKGFDILSISIDTDEKAWLKAVKDEDLKWSNVLDTDQSISNLYKVNAVPTMYVIDGEGRLVAENLRGEQLAEKIKELVETNN